MRRRRRKKAARLVPAAATPAVRPTPPPLRYYLPPAGTVRPGSMKAPECRICSSPYTAYVRDVPLHRMAAEAPLYYCLTCGSFWHPQLYVEDDAQLQRDAAWHITHAEERNIHYSTRLFDAIANPDPSQAHVIKPIRSLIEIGAATGTLLDVAARRGIEGVGFDTNPYAARIAHERHGITIRQELWDRDTIDRRYDAVFCISVMEHLPNPQALAAEIAAYCRRHGSAAYVSVPFLSENYQWHFLLNERAESLADPFFLSDVHINHFSHAGFAGMFRNAGARTLDRLDRDWYGYWMTF